MMLAAESGPVLLSHKPLRDTDIARRMVETAESLPPSVQPAEVAQARLFEVILQAEVARLEQLANRTAGPLEWLRPPGIGSVRDLMRIHARIDEVGRLLDALRNRFPDGRLDYDRQPSACGEARS